MATYYVNSYREDDGTLGLGATIELGTPPNEDLLSQRIRAAWKVDGVDSNDEAIGTLLTYLADQYIGSDITVTRLVPRERTLEERLQTARDILRADYWDDVRSVVSDFTDNIESGHIVDRESAETWIDETVDGHGRVIYTGRAIECLLFSDNDSAYHDQVGEETDNWSTLAYYAFRQDVIDLLGDIDDLLAEHQPECYLCGVAFTDDDETEMFDWKGEAKRTHVTCPEDDEEGDDDG